jgi:murein DD-endopeptidase MepM/ murein hydrolase activator NlpD
MNDRRQGIAAGRLGAGMFAAAVLSVGAAVAGTEPDRAVPELVPRPVFDLQVAVPPTPVVVMDTAYLVYELHLTNFARQTAVVSRVEVVGADGGDRVLAEFGGEALERRLNPPAAGHAVPASARAIEPGVRRVLYLEIPTPPGASPAALEHRVTYRTNGADPGEDSVVQGGRVAVAAEPPVTLGPPLRGGPWAALHQPCWERGHRRVHYAVDGRARIPGRFAMDWTRLDAEGHPSRGDDDVVANWHAHGAEVLAVANGIVAAMRDDVPESATFSNRLEHPPEEAEGNFISLDLGGGRYAFYGHLRTGSITVAPGERVRRGQVIGQVGFTGHAGRPQLHFHVGDASASNGAEGLPFVFDAFILLGGYGPGDARSYGSRDSGCVDAAAALEGLGSTPWTPVGGETDARRTGEMPAPNAVVEFPAQAGGEGG